MENVLTQAKAAANRKATSRAERTRNVCSPRSAQLQIRNALNAENSENVFNQSLRWWFVCFLAELEGAQSAPAVRSAVCLQSYHCLG
jgi:hypothetical protein